MAALPNQPNGSSNEAEDVQPDGEVETLIASAITIFADLEWERVALQREQHAATLRGCEVLDNGDRRQHETAVKRIEAENEQDKRRHVQVIIAICLGFGVPTALLALALITALYDSERNHKLHLMCFELLG